jgi:hypothetical protein
MKTRFAGVFVLALALWGGEVEAQDFGIEVPVVLSDIHADVTAFKVNCYVSVPGTGGIAPLPRILLKNGRTMSIAGIVTSGGTTSYQFNSDVMPLEADGSYSGAVGVSMDFPGVPDAMKRRANRIVCGLALVSNDQVQTPGKPAGPPWATPAEGTEFVARVVTFIPSGN